MPALFLQSQGPSSQWRPGFAAAYFLAYLAMQYLNAAVPALNLGVAPWNPQTGLTLAFLIVCGPNRAWLTGIAALLSDLAVNGPAAAWAAQAASAALLAACYELAARLLPLPAGGNALDSSRYHFRLIGTALVLGLALALCSLLPAAVAGALHIDELIRTGALRWIANSNGVLTLTPLLLAAPRWRAGVLTLIRRRWEAPVHVLAVAGMLGLVLWLRAVSDVRVFYPLFMPMVWVAFRWGVVGTTWYMLAIQLGLMAADWNAPLAPSSFTGPQFLLLTLSATGLLLASVVAEWRAGEARLHERDATLARAMRSAAVGELASALTHELNQPITALVSYLRASRILAQPLADGDGRLTQTLDKAAREAIRAAEVLSRLRDFYRGGAPQLAVVNLRELTHSVLVRHEERLRQIHVQPRSLFEPELPAVICDRTHLEIILHNLLGNAIEAVSEGGDSIPREIALAAKGSEASVLLSIEDSGPGVAPDIGEHLFDPFVTTKPAGTGLGLALSRSLLRSLGGDIWAERSSLGGARFVLRIPLTASVQAAL